MLERQTVQLRGKVKSLGDGLNYTQNLKYDEITPKRKEEENQRNHAETWPAGKPLACTVKTAVLQPSWLNCAGKGFGTDGKEGAKEKKRKTQKWQHQRRLYSC